MDPVSPLLDSCSGSCEILLIKSLIFAIFSIAISSQFWDLLLRLTIPYPLIEFEMICFFIFLFCLLNFIIPRRERYFIVRGSVNWKAISEIDKNGFCFVFHCFANLKFKIWEIRCKVVFVVAEITKGTIW